MVPVCVLYKDPIQYGWSKTGVKDPLPSSACSLTVGSKVYNLISVSVIHWIPSS